MTEKNYRIITSGNNKRREYFSLNRSSLFSELPTIDTAQEQKRSYYHFLFERLKNLLGFYFPVELKDHNNIINLDVKDIIFREPELNVEETYSKNLTWSYTLFLKWKADWVCYSINIPLEENETKNKEEEEKNIIKWVEKSFKIGSFETKKTSLESEEDEWEIKEKKNNTSIIIKVKEKKTDSLTITFRYQQEREILFCHLPKMNEQGIFVINGHHKVAVCQSVRAPSIYCFFNEEQQKYYTEIIPSKGSWINISFNYLLKRLELKFLNSKKIIGLRNTLEYYNTPDELIDLLLLGIEEKEKKTIKTSVEIPKFLFTNKNSYFEFGSLGRKKFNNKMLIRKRVLNHVLAENITNLQGDVIFLKDTIIDKNNIEQIEKLLLSGVNSFLLPNSTNELYWIKVKSTSDEIVSVIGIIDKLPDNKIYFDLADLFCAVSLYSNVKHKIIPVDLEEEKDKLGNQIIRRIGDLLYSMFDSKFGGFLYQDMPQKYLANISQLKKTDLAKMPNLRDFDSILRSFFNTSPLIQLQNQNNPLSEIAYTRKVSVLGLGGFSANNITLTARNVDDSHYGRYGLMSTQEGKNFGLNHNLTLGAVINEDGQITVPYRLVKNRTVLEEIVYLTSDDEFEYRIAHCNIRLDEKNKMLDEKIMVRYRGNIIKSSTELVDYIDSSFFHLTSVEESVVPFTSYNDATRVLMTSNMQRGAIPLVKNEEPLIATGAEATLRKNSFLAIKAKEEGEVEYVDNTRIVIKEKKQKTTYKLNQLLITNKEILNFSTPLVKKGDKVSIGQFLADGHYSRNGELSLGYNLRVAYTFYHCNFEDAIVFSDRLIKKDIFTYVVAKEYTISRYNTNYGPEVFSATDTFSGQKISSHLDDDGIVKTGSVVNESDVLVRKLTPQMSIQESEEEMLLLKILGGKGQKFIDSSLYLPKGESDRGVVYSVEREQKNEKDELEIVKVRVAYERKLEDGDKVTARYGNKGIIKIIPAADMPYTEEGQLDVILNPLGVPSRMNMGQLLETILAEAAYRLNIKLLIRPFNTIELKDIEKIVEEAKIKEMGNRTIWDGKTGLPFERKVYTGRIYMTLLNHKSADKIHARATGPYSLIFQQPLKGRKRDGGQRVGEMEGWCLEAHGAAKTLLRLFSADDIQKRFDLQNYLFFGKRHFNLLYNKSESFNLIIQYLRGIGFNLEAKDFQDKKIDLYKYFSS